MSKSARAILAQRALQASVDARARHGPDLNVPMDVYAFCERAGVSVQFVGFSMEGLYIRGTPARILLSALRPLPRRAFTCAHEFGHHVFGHGFTIDQLTDDLDTGRVFDPDEFLVQSFAGFLLMPTIGVRKAFNVRGWTASAATPAQLFVIACSFGVGFGTLVSHLAYGLNMVPAQRAAALLKIAPARVRRDLLGLTTAASLLVVDAHWQLPTIDAEVGMEILFPPGSKVEGDLLSHRGDLAAGRLFEAVRPGIGRVVSAETEAATFVRITRKAYVGLSRYRHLAVEDGDDDEDVDAE